MSRLLPRPLQLCALLSLAAFAACKDGGATAAERQPVASVTITGVADSVLPVGATLQLSTQLKDAAGTVLSRPVTWTSTDSAVLSVSNRGLVTARKPGSATVVAESEGTTGIALFDVVVPVRSVTVAATAGAGYVGQTLQLQASALDSTGGPLSGRKLTWTSSDNARATVDANGLVTVLGTGAVVINATAEGHTGSLTLTLLTRPVADWSQVADWTTFQGNPQHDGFVAGTLDPVAFQPRWVATPAYSTPLNPVTAAGGKVFISNNTYYGRQLLTVYDAATGTQLWTHEFGAIHSVHPPAYSGGTVYVTTGGHQDSYLWAFSAADGSLTFRSPFANQWSHYYAPTVANGTVYMAGGLYDGMYAFGATDGVQRWFVGTDQDDQWTPAVANGKVYAYTGVSNPRLTVVNASDGSVAYEVPDAHFSSHGYSMDVAPALGGANDLLVTQGYRLVSFDLAARGLAWEIPATFTGNVTVAAGVLYVRNGDGVDARRESDGQLLWHWSAPTGGTIGNLVATRNLLFVSTTDRTYAVDLAAHKHTWSYPASGTLTVSRDGLLLIAGANGKLTAVTLR